MSDLAPFKGDIVAPGDEDYERAITRWAANATRRARIVAYVRDAEDIATALRYAQVDGLKIAIHGGGHSPNGASSVEDGLVIDLSRYLNSVRVDPEARLAYVGGGAKWADVDKATMAHGLAMTGGIVSHTGVGGLTLGGGYGWLAPMHGLTIDHLVSANIVSADGVVRIASKTENPDLFWGIRGGGCNFGIVTEFVFRLHPQRRTVFGGAVMFSPDKLEAIAQLIEKWYPTAGEKEGMHVVLGRGFDGNPNIMLLMLYNGSEAEGRENFKAFTDLGSVMDMRQEMPYEVFNSFRDHWLSPGKCHWFRSFLVDRAEKVLTRETFDEVTELTNPEKPFNQSTLAFEYMPQAKINNVPNGETAYSRNRPGLGNGLAHVIWDENKPELLEEAKRIAQQMIELPLKIGGPQYGNYNADTEAALPTAEAKSARAQALYGDNYLRLQQIKRKFDPNMVFDKWFVIQPSLE
ncbi:uncharacterized protein PHACADRAFT_187189 [Phanerochaete carnosa HHB-10118-sp]|uniref:FAD-binding PCMH-type domain-containing protein n=1 Tax=Phanerochaete carnosa (strain HHB-10118-sp) TaxID=650164 RepID=K5VK83_PHACS|nr:uncharacterized protein PHACADRAFT_187189 [Phanerochaete carnosa HHB-10118-sp]EKM51783.1 hypothetical protein PHACADRAFT_187189 [Phanerochaete carnosa HHB-10118-sp]